jgi:hypothetical protein
MITAYANGEVHEDLSKAGAKRRDETTVCSTAGVQECQIS